MTRISAFIEIAFLFNFLLILPTSALRNQTCNESLKNITTSTRGNQGAVYLSSSSRYGLAGGLSLPMPRHAEVGDLMLLFLSRTDGVLPTQLNDGWTTGPSCFKEDNGGNHQRQCWYAEDCISHTYDHSGTIQYCSRFPYNDTGRDLATIVFYKPILNETDLNRFYHWNLPGLTPAWATLVTLSGVNHSNPFRSAAGVACDRRAAAVFPSVYGREGYVLLLSMAHDDAAQATQFQAPWGTRLISDNLHGSDEAGFLFAKRLNRTGHTQKQYTRGAGTQWWCKDALLSVVVRTVPEINNNNRSNELVFLDDEDYASPCGTVNNDYEGFIFLTDVIHAIVNGWKYIRNRWRYWV